MICISEFILKNDPRKKMGVFTSTSANSWRYQIPSIFRYSLPSSIGTTSRGFVLSFSRAIDRHFPYRAPSRREVADLVDAVLVRGPNITIHSAVGMDRNIQMCADDVLYSPPRLTQSLLNFAIDVIPQPATTASQIVVKRAKNITGPLGPQFLVNLLQALRRFKRKSFCDAAAEMIAARPETFSPATIVVPALQQIQVERARKAAKLNGSMVYGVRDQQIQVERARKAAASDSSILYLWRRSAEFLLRRSEVPPEPPSDWRQDVKLSCSCPDCRELQSFARDPAQIVYGFRVKKERRQHLHNVIDKDRLDMTHITERAGSPQTLVCTKDRRTFNRRMKEYEREIGAMRTLLELAPGYDEATVLSTRMQAAVERAG